MLPFPVQSYAHARLDKEAWAVKMGNNEGRAIVSKIKIFDTSQRIYDIKGLSMS